MTDNTQITQPDSQQHAQPQQSAQQPQQQPRQSSVLSDLFRGIGTFGKWVLIICTFALIGLLVAAYLTFRSISSSNANIEVDKRIGITPTQIESIKHIGQWEFLSVADEEMIDTIRRGFFSDDELIRIYYGTVRLGIDMNQVSERWIRKDKDTIEVLLPPVQLLDDNFIDEARTQSFFEKGSWSDADREAMYHRAYQNMKKRCLNAENINSAEQNATRQFHQLMTSMGFSNIRIRFEKTYK